VLKHHQIKDRISKYVEVRGCKGEILENDYKPGYVLLTYSDDKDDEESVERRKVLGVTVDDSENKEKELSFTLSVAELSDENAVKKMTFSCNTAEQVGEWEKSIVSALDEVRKNNDRMYEQFIVKIQFTKEKMGIRVEERRISVKEKQPEKKKPRESKGKESD